jgi:hypothetical protein
MLLNDTTIKVLPTPGIIVTSVAKFLLVGGNREFRITVNSWPCISLPIFILNQTNLLFTLLEQTFGDAGFFSAAIILPDIGVAGLQKLKVSGTFNGNSVWAETTVQFRMNSPSITLASGRSSSDSTGGQVERIFCRDFPNVVRNQDVVVGFGNIFVAPNIVFSSDKEAFMMLDVIIPAQSPQMVSLSVNVREIRATAMFEYRVPGVAATCSDENFVTSYACSVSSTGGSLYVRLSPAIEGAVTFSGLLQNANQPLSLNSSTPISSIITRLEIYMPARTGLGAESDSLCISALGLGRIVCFPFSYKIPPTPLSAYFDSFGASISFTFASETQMPVDCRLIFSPAALVFLGGQNAVCIWASSTSLRVILPPAAVVVPGNLLQVYVLNSGNSSFVPIEVQPPLQPASLDVQLVGSGNVSVCDTLKLQAVVSLSRALVYSWSCLPPCPQNFDALLRSSTGPNFAADASKLPVGVPLTVTVAVSTFLGASSSSPPLRVYVDPSPLPSVSISPSAKKLLRRDFLELSAISTFASCTVDFERMTFAWSIRTKAQLSDDTIRLIASAAQSVLLLQPYSLISGFDYEFIVAIKKGSLVNSAGVTVTVLPGQLNAVIDGGSRTVAVRDSFVLDGSRSTDSDAIGGFGAGLLYCWSCQRVRGNDAEPCRFLDGPLFGTPVILPCLSVIKFSLQNITETQTDLFVFILTLQSSDGRIGSDSVTLSLSSDSRASLDVYVRSSCVANVCKDSDPIVLTTNISLSFFYSWTLVLSPKLGSSLSFDPSSSLLRFQPVALPPGKYEFRCVITDAKASSGQSSIKFQVAAAPKGGSCKCTDPAAPSTSSTVSCSGWNTLFPPLR